MAASGLSAADAAKRLKALRDEIKDGKHGQGPFEIVVRSTGDTAT
jgi:hypothetical protein